jgi:hypothetical protein
MNPRHLTCSVVGGLVALLCLAAPAMAQNANVWYVDDDAPPGGSGDSWESPFTFLSEALLFAEHGDTILVAQGTYYPDRDSKYPTGSGFREQSFDFLGSVALFGGYAGYDAPDPDIRDLELYPTILSGEINTPAREDNTYHVVYCGSESSPLIDGVTITGGYTGYLMDGPFGMNGAGIYVEFSAPTFVNCIIENNHTAAGITDKLAGLYHTGGNGAGLYSEYGDVVLLNCIFRDNHTGNGADGECWDIAWPGTAGGNGAGLYFTYSDAQLINCTIVNNTTGDGGAGGFCDYEPGECSPGADGGSGAGLFFDESWAMLTSCLIAGNIAGNGGAGISDDDVECLGGAGGSGGGIRALESPIVLQSCTIADNTAGQAGSGPAGADPGYAGGLFAVGEGAPYLDGCIFWGNVSSVGTPREAQFLGIIDTISYSCIQGWDDSVPGSGNIGDDPLFVAPGSEYHITIASPCLNAGNPEYEPYEGETDIDGEDRVANGRIDIGADELAFDDCNENGIPDEIDIASGFSQDCNENGVPDECDIAEGASADINENGVPDECETDCNENGIPDEWEISQGFALDCNENGVPDECDIAEGASADINENGIPDECETDCNENGIPDEWEISQGLSPDCNENGVPDECDIAAGTSADINENGVPDECETDCNENGIPDEWEISQGFALDCNENGVPDECDIADGTSADINENGVPDECETDCNENGIPDCWEILQGFAPDCNNNGIPDECDIASGFSADCNENGIPDECDIASGDSEDCNENGIPDECELDSDGDGIIDDCDNCPDVFNPDQADSDNNGIGDACDEPAGRPEPPASCLMRCLIAVADGAIAPELEAECDCVAILGSLADGLDGRLSGFEFPDAADQPGRSVADITGVDTDDTGADAPAVPVTGLCPATATLMLALSLAGICHGRRRTRQPG